ncbi:MAG: SdrD B-like domain-containing protein [Planctomycetaceae bacterium]
MQTFGPFGTFSRLANSFSVWLASLLKGRQRRLNFMANRRRQRLASAWSQTQSEMLEDRTLLAAVLGATLDDQVVGTVQAGDGITYLATISNTGDTNATNVQLTDPLDANTTFVGGSTKIGVAAFADNYDILGNTPRTVAVGGGLLSNDADIDAGGAFTVTGTTDIGGTANNGTLVANADGSFTYTPAAGTNGTDIFQYEVTDSDGLISTGTVTFTIGGMVWYVDNTAGGGGDGSFSNPFDDFAELDAGGADPDAPGDTIFVFSGAGSTTDSITLENNQSLIGEGVGLSAILNGVNTQLIAPGTAPTLAPGAGNVVTLASNNTVRGLNISATGATGLSGLNFGSATINNVSVSAMGVGSTAINLNNGGGTMSFANVSASGGTNGIVLNAVNATSFSVTGDGSTATQGGNDSGGIIQNTTGDGVLLTNSNNITLQNMTIGNPAATSASGPDANVSIVGDGIHATTVTNLTLNNVTIAETGDDGVDGTSVTNFVMNDSMVLNAGNDNEETAVFFSQLAGDNFIRRSLFDAFHESGVEVQNSSGSADLTIDNTTFQDNKGSAFGSQAILLIATGSANIVAKVTGTAGAGTQSIFDDVKLNAIHAISEGTSSDIQLTVENTRILETGAGDAMIIMNTDNAGTGNITVNNVYFTDDTPNVFPFAPAAIIVKNDSSGLLDATITNNNADGVQLLLLNHDDIGSGGAANGTTRALISNNVVDVRSEGSIGIDIIASETGPTGTGPDLSLTITNNTVTLPDDIFFFVSGLRINATNNARVNAQITGNTFESDADGSGGSGIELQQLNSSVVNLAAPFGGGNAAAAIAFLTAQNPASENPAFVTGNFGVGSPIAPAVTTMPSPLVVAPPVSIDGGSFVLEPTVPGTGLSQSDLDAAVAEAIARWAAAGASAAQIAQLQAVDVSVASLGSLLLGIHVGDSIRIDDNAGGFGWFIDSSITDDAEFAGGSNGNQVDLLTVVMHEFGHVLGVPHTADGLMGSALSLGVRHNPTADLVAAAGTSTGASEALSVAVAPPGGGTDTGTINIGTLPLGSSTQVRFQATVTNGPGLPNSISAQGTVTADGGFNFLTDDPAVGGAADATVAGVESLTLGGTVWQEANANTTYQSGTDTGLNGVTVNLYLDNGDGVLTGADGAPIATTTTSNMAAEDGRYEFTNLAPGNYIVEVTGAPLATLASIAGTVDPDNNVDHDDNGDPVAGFGVASSAITLDYGTEPGGDVNETLDLGFTAAVVNTLTVSINLASMSENGGSSSATVTRSGSTVGNLIVNLASNDATEGTVPASVTILDGQASANFTVTGVDDAVLDGTQTVTITASAGGFIAGADTIDVTDDEVPLDTTTPANVNLLGSGSLIIGANGTVHNDLHITFDTNTGHYILEDIIPLNPLGGLVGNDLNPAANIIEFDPTAVGAFNNIIVNLNIGNDTLTVHSLRDGGPEGLDVRNDVGEGNDTINIAGPILNAGGQVLLRSENITLGGQVTTNNQNIRLEGDVTLAGNSDVNGGTATVIATGTINGPHGLMVSGGLVQLDGDIGNASPPNGLSVTGNIVRVQNVTVNGGDATFTADNFIPQGTIGGDGNLTIRRNTAGTQDVNADDLQFIQPGFASVTIGSGLTTQLTISSDGDNDFGTGSVNVGAPLVLVGQSIIVADSIQQGTDSLTLRADNSLQFVGIGVPLGTGDVNIEKLNAGGTLTILGNIGSPKVTAPWGLNNTSVSAPGSTVNFTGGVGNGFASFTANAGSLLFNSPGAVTAQGDVDLTANDIQLNGGVFSQTGGIRLAGNVNLTGNVLFKVGAGSDLLVDGGIAANGFNILVRGNGGAADEVNFIGDVVGAGSFQIDSSGASTANEVSLNGVSANKVVVRANGIELAGDVTSDVNVQFIGPVTLSADVSIMSGNDAAFFTQFTSTVNGAHNLSVNSGAGRAVFAGEIGNTDPLGNLNVVSTANNFITRNVTIGGNFDWNNTGGKLTLTSGKTVSAGGDIDILADVFTNLGSLVAGGTITTP